MTKKLDITDSKILAQEGICFICDDCLDPNLPLVKEFLNLKTCDIVSCQNATCKTYDLTDTYKAIIKKHPEKNPVFKQTSIDRLITEGLLLDNGEGKIFANYDFLNRYQDILEGVNSRDNLVECTSGCSLNLDLFRGNKILIEVDVDEDLSYCEIKNEVISKPNTEFTFDDLIVIANNFANASCKDFTLTKNYLNATLGY